MWILLNKLSVYNLVKEFNNKLKTQPSNITNIYNINREMAYKYNNYQIKNINYYTPIRNIYLENNNNFYDFLLDVKKDKPFVENITNTFESSNSDFDSDSYTDSDSYSDCFSEVSVD